MPLAKPHSLSPHLRGLAYWAQCASPVGATILARDLPLGLELEGYKRDLVGRILYLRRIYEPGLTRLLIETFSGRPGGHFLDVGSNIGYYACLLGKLAGPSGKVTAIEPEPDNRRLLEANLRRNGLANVTVHGCAAGAVNGTARMGVYKAVNRGRHSLVTLEGCETFIDVPVRRLDDLVATGDGAEKESAPAFSFIKMDAEGSEPFAIEGAPHTLARAGILAMEYAVADWRRAGIAPAPVLATLAARFSDWQRWQGDDLVPVTPEECTRSEATMDLVLRP